jgi:RNA polymerase sigma-70 factor (ECF subfamily)
MTEPEPTAALRAELRSAWHHYVDALVPFRPLLHGYCLRLTGSVWDAEDLVQETLLRAFGRWGVTHPGIRNPRAYLLRTATNVWIDALRRRGTEARAPEVEPDATPGAAASPEQSSRVREAGSRLLQRLAPQERAAVVLKEAFDMSLDEIADLLATTRGAVKAALHRGRGRLAEPPGGPASRRAAPSAALLDRFVDRVGARDLDGLVALLLHGASAENPGNSYHVGLDSEEGVLRFLRAVVHGHPEWPPEYQRDASRLARAEFEGEWVLLGFATRRGREALESVFRLDEREGRIARIRSYAFCPETVRAVGEALGLRVRTGIYRAPE